MFYRAYGLIIKSDLLLPELIEIASQPERVDVEIALASIDPAGLGKAAQISETLHVQPGHFWLNVRTIARFEVHAGCRIRIDPDAGAEAAAIRVYLLGSVFGALLYQRGFLVLHGNAIRIGNHSLICLGSAGAGKSTLAAKFLQRGYSLLADDVVPIDDRQAAIPGFPRIKIWQDSAARLDIETSGLERISRDIAKFNYPLKAGFCNEPLPVKWIYILDQHTADSFQIDPITGIGVYERLYEHTYRLEYLEAMALEAAHLDQCGQLAGVSRLARLLRPASGFDPDAIVSTILTDIGVA